MARALQRWQQAGELPGELKVGQWFSFEDIRGYGCCQTDILIVTEAFVFILECKLTYTDWAWNQLRKLYKPIVERVFGRPSITIQVCKNIKHAAVGLVEGLLEIMDSPRDGCLTWHFLG